MAHCTFDASPGADGKVRVGVWDLVCVPGHDEKDGQSTDFNVDTLSQMTANFEERADPIPLDFNHQSNLVAQNGQPAPALAFYGALAVVAGGQIIKFGIARDTPPLPGSIQVSPATAQLTTPDLSRDGLWCFRSEVTELGQKLLPNFKLVSPTFLPNGTKRDGTPCGYCLAAVAATNTPWQSGTEITFGRNLTGAAGASGVKQMAKLAKLASFAGLKDDDSDESIKQGIMSRLSKMAMDEACMDADDAEAYSYDDKASELDAAAAAYDDAHFEDDGESPSVAMRKMAAKFRRMGKMKMDGGNSAGPRPGLQPENIAEQPPLGKLEPAKPEGARTGDENKMAVMQASLEATRAQLAKLQAKEDEREKAAARESERRFESLADQAVAGGYPKEARAALIKFARTDYSGAHASVAHLLPKTGAPAHLFDRLSRSGAPIDGETSARSEFGAIPAKKVVKNGFGRWVEVDSALADEIKRVAESTDPSTRAKVDKYIHQSRREVMFDRLQAAGKIVSAERPDLVAAAEND